ncbi:MAG: hypothetical protein EA376_09545 [Phycisphaeraceae bacterium]|nr:MAG: hypothetical protein EA376_09545 [Phycisphaeraceae bacterium]
MNERIKPIEANDAMAEERRGGRWVLIMAPPRTGSTWLFDAIRCHPLVRVRREATLFRSLGLEKFNRYPRDLAGVAPEGMEIELRCGVMATIPDFHADDTLETPAPPTGAAARWIEKAHPGMFDCDAGRIDEALARFERERGEPVDLVYRVRDPIETIASILGYKRRSETWYNFLPERRICALVESSLACTMELRERRPGAVVDYAEHKENGAAALARVFERLWPEVDSTLHSVAATQADRLTSRRRPSGGSADDFFAMRNPASEEEEAEALQSLLDADRELVDSCRERYASLLGARETPVESTP